jgi:hypothetical protein
MVVRSVSDWMVRGYAQSSIRRMAIFLDDNAIYRDFPKTKLSITNNETGCKGGARQINGLFVPCIDISVPYVTEYTLTGFHEYDHIYEDPEIGSIEFPTTWRHTLAAVICHEMAHAVVMMHELTKTDKIVIPETYHSYSVDFIRTSCANERKSHGTHWQYTYRQLRNEFVNHKPKNYW